MPSFIEFGCQCGRLVRATREQVGQNVRCWNCGSEVAVPQTREASEFGRGFTTAVADTFEPRTLAVLAVGALAVTALLYVPYVGPLLGFAGLVAGARLYQQVIQDSAPTVHPATPEAEDVDDGPPEWALWGLSVFGAAGLVAPFVIRWSTPGLPVRARWALMAVAVAGWVVVPLVLYVVNARDRNGPVPRRWALAKLADSPLTAVAALLVVPLTFCLTEVVTSAVCQSEFRTSTLVERFYPPPIVKMGENRPVNQYVLDDLTVRLPVGYDDENSVVVYRTGLHRGFTLTGLIPLTLRHSLDFGVQGLLFDPSFVALGGAMTILIMTLTGVALSIQSHAMGSVATTTYRPRPSSVPTPAPSPPEPPPAPAARAGVGVGVGAGFGSGFRTGLGQVPPAVPETAARPFAVSHTPPPPAFVPSAAPGVANAIPWTVSVPSPSPAESRATPVNHVPLASTVLIVDADRGFAVGLAHILSARGYGVILAGSALEALAMAKGGRPDLVVFDMRLPDRSGPEFSREIRDAFPGTDRPILVASSQTATPDEIASMASSADDYLIKPYVIEMLMNRIAHHLQSRH